MNLIDRISARLLAEVDGVAFLYLAPIVGGLGLAYLTVHVIVASVTS